MLLLQFDPGDEADPKRLRRLYDLTQRLMIVKGAEAQMATDDMVQMATEEGKKISKKGTVESQHNELDVMIII